MKIFHFLTAINLFYAGVLIPEHKKTEEGFEMNFGTNHLGHFLLTHLLLPLVRKSVTSGFRPRIIIVASVAHTFVKNGIDWEDLMHEKKFETMPVYGHSKLANILHANELARRLKDSNINVYSLHPGNTTTF